MNDDIMNKSMVIYRITNNLNGKTYVGQTQRTLEERMRYHLKEDLYVDRAIKKHGIENFTVDVLEQCATLDELNEQEKYWIATLNTKAPNGYNLTDGGNGVAGFSHTEESRIKISQSMKEFCKNPDARARLAALAQQNAADSEKRAEMSKKLKEIYEDQEIRDRIGAAVKEALSDPDVRQRHSEGLKQYYEEHLEARAQKAETTKRINSTPEMRAFISERTKAALADPEKRKKISEGTKRGLARKKAEREAAQQAELEAKNNSANNSAIITLSFE